MHSEFFKLFEVFEVVFSSCASLSCARPCVYILCRKKLFHIIAKINVIYLKLESSPNLPQIRSSPDQQSLI